MNGSRAWALEVVEPDDHRLARGEPLGGRGEHQLRAARIELVGADAALEQRVHARR